MKAGWMSGMVVCLIGWGIAMSVSAQEAKPADPQVSHGQVEKPSSPMIERKSLESLLRTPAKLDFGGRTKVPALEILEELRKQHQLSIRFDLPTFAWFMGREAILSEEEEVEVVTATAVVEQAPVVVVPVAETQNAAPPAVAAPQEEGSSPDEPEGSSGAGVFRELLAIPVDIGTMNPQTVSIGTMLKQLLESIPLGPEEEMGLPIPMTNAMMLDYIVEEDGILITTRMQALTRKETRVYTVKNLKDFPPEQLAKLIRKTIRPYSWRAQFDDFGDKLKGVSLPTQTLVSLMQTGAAMADLENVTITTTEGGAIPSPTPVVPGVVAALTPPADPTEAAKQLEAAGNALANVFVALTHAGLLTVEMIHYGDPPTATIETLPGKLVVTQSQGAHREIADLLEDLARE